MTITIVLPSVVRGPELRSFPEHSFAIYVFLVDAITGMAN